jgi:hypothetical protein
MSVVVCCGEQHPADRPRQIQRSSAWQRFTMLRFLGVKGGGRQRTKAGQGLEEYLCGACAMIEDTGAEAPAELAF